MERIVPRGRWSMFIIRMEVGKSGFFLVIAARALKIDEFMKSVKNLHVHRRRRIADRLYTSYSATLLTG